LSAKPQTASALNHPNICTIYEIEEHGGEPFIVMELLEGDTLRNRMAASEPKTISVLELFDIATQVSNGLQAAHDKGHHSTATLSRRTFS